MYMFIAGNANGRFIPSHSKVMATSFICVANKYTFVLFSTLFYFVVSFYLN